MILYLEYSFKIIQRLEYLVKIIQKKKSLLQRVYGLGYIVGGNQLNYEELKEIGPSDHNVIVMYFLTLREYV